MVTIGACPIFQAQVDQTEFFHERFVNWGMSDEVSIAIDQAIVFPDIIVKDFGEQTQLGVFIGN